MKLATTLSFTSLSLLLLAAGDAAASSGPAYGSNVYFNPHNGRHYHVVNQVSLTRDVAAAFAEKIGGTLLVLDDAQEQAWFQSNVAPWFNWNPDNTLACWLGIDDVQQEGQWKTPGGAPLTYTNWNAGEPNNANAWAGGEDFAEINAVTGKWNDVGPDAERKVVVELDMPDVFVDPVSGRQYLLSNDRMNLQSARDLAYALGGRLVSVNGVAEHFFLVNTIGPWMKKIAMHGAWIGLSDSANEGQFVWDSGEPLTFQNWGWNEPNDGDDPNYSEDGVIMTSGNFEWNDIGHDGNIHALIELTGHLTISAYNGPGSIEFAVRTSYSNQIAATLLTSNTQGVGTGWFYGINPAVQELAIQYQSMVAPFVMFLDEQGDATWQMPSGVPTGFQFAAVTLVLNSSANVIEATRPITYTTY